LENFYCQECNFVKTGNIFGEGKRGQPVKGLTPFGKVKDEESTMSYPEGTKEENF